MQVVRQAAPAEMHHECPAAARLDDSAGAVPHAVARRMKKRRPIELVDIRKAWGFPHIRASFHNVDARMSQSTALDRIVRDLGSAQADGVQPRQVVERDQAGVTDRGFVEIQDFQK